MNNILYFTECPKTWEHYLPLGNGRLGAMIKTHPCNEIIQLNEEGIWSGGPQSRLNKSAKKNLNHIRRLVKNGSVMEAQELTFRAFSGTSFNQRVYQTAGDFRLDFYEEKDYGIEPGFPLNHKTHDIYLKTYNATLDVSKAIATLNYKDDEGNTYTRTSFISAKKDMFFMHVTCSSKNKINFRGYFDRGIYSDSIYAKDGFVFLEDAHGIPFCAGCGVVSDTSLSSKTSVTGVCLEGSKCNEVLFFIDIRAWQKQNQNHQYTKKQYEKETRKNTWTPLCYKKLAEIKKEVSKLGVKKAFEIYLDEHIKEYFSYYNKMTLEVGKEANQNQNIPLSKMLCDVDENSTNLINLYANFSRYLLICGSRSPGRMPLTLQGLWNCYMDPPWGSKYTININTQMNYWPAAMCALSECELPLFYMLEDVYKTGVETAKKMYGCRGYVCHHNTDYWGDSAPQDSWLPGTYWVLGAAWLATCIYEHFEYTRDFSFLQKYYYLMHEACLFFVDFLEPASKKDDREFYLVINPSVSPENSYVTKSGQVGCFCEGCQMDNMILHHLFYATLNAKKLLEQKACNLKGKPYSKKDFDDFEYVFSHLKKPAFNEDGSLMEWNERVQEVEKGHRHISHLYGLFPGRSLNVEDEQIKNACKKTLQNRLLNGGGHTGWSQAWIINFYASLYMKNEALSSIIKLLKHSTLPNLLDNHPPFQIDGNFGALCGIMRLFVQSYIEENIITVKLLPVLPENESFSQGVIKGACVKGGLCVDFEWKEGRVTKYSFYKNGKTVLPKDEQETDDGSYIFHFCLDSID